MVKEIVMDPLDIIEYVRNEVKVDDIFELSYNRVFAPGTVLGLTPEDEETGEGLIISLQLCLVEMKINLSSLKLPYNWLFFNFLILILTF